MANVIRLKRASGSDPTASDLVSGEPAVRTDTGELFFKKDDGSVAKVSGAGGGPDFKYLALRNAANNGAASYPNADFTLVTSGTTTALTPTAANTLLVSVNGVIQKPNTGTSTPSSGFALSGSTIKFGANLSAAPDFILYQESGGIGEPSDETVSEAKLKVSNNPVNGYFLSAQSGNTGGLTWAAPVATSCTGNSATATALATARAINGVNFDGTAAITVTAAAGTLTGTTLKSTVVTSSLTSLGDLAGLTVDGDATFTGANYNVLWDKSDNALEFADNAKTVFGTGNDLQIYHDGSHSRIVDTGTGDLKLQTDFLSIVNAGNTEHMAKFIENGAVELYHDNSKRLETSANGNTLFGTQQNLNGDVKFDNQTNSGMDLRWDESLNRLHFEQDNIKAVFGTGSDLEIYHNGTNSLIYNSTGTPLKIQNVGSNGADVHIQARPDEEGIKLLNNSGESKVELYYDNSKVLETMTQGVRITDNFLEINDTSCHLDFMENGSSNNHRLRQNAGNLYIQKLSDDKNTSTTAIIVDGGNEAVELYQGGNKKFETTSSGVTVTGSINVSGISRSSGNIFVNNNDTSNGIISFATNTNDRWKIDFSGHFVPANNNDVNIGSSSKRVANVYTNDLNLSNEGGSNDVDGTWGSYTIQEGEESLFLINKRNGKKYKFNLTEVS